MTIRMNLKMEARSQENTSQGTFSLTCWEWAPLYFLLVDYCSSLIDEDTLRKLADFGASFDMSCVTHATRQTTISRVP